MGGKAEIRSADLGQLTLQAQTMQSESKVVAGREHKPHGCRRTHKQELELAQQLVVAHLVQVVEQQPDPLLQAPQIGQQMLDDRPAVEVGRGRQGLDDLRTRGCASERVGY